MPDQAEAATARPRMDLQKIETWVDHAIQQAQRNGDFDDLPGAGKPLDRIDRAGDDPDWWIKGLIQREKLDMTGALPTALALRRERSTFPEALVELAEEAQVRQRLEDFNERVLADRRKPYFGTGSPVVVGRVDIEEMVAAWREAREAHQAVTAESAGEPATVDGAAPRRRWWQRTWNTG
ncbi:DUF1992 domain-containing protein [Ornithinicoccus hortensis]|uniref:DnaJ family domain-containing protein n=1 Tax=Ornithinicoccus hortensis TaxID=82346 RepID=UPI001E444FDE|nr:DUF1992 domain-containing protein [Ornithinicoccus hortensis]